MLSRLGPSSFAIFDAFPDEKRPGIEAERSFAILDRPPCRR
jgi:hypothetical protein